MKYIEELIWILDKPGTTPHNQEEQFRENIAFVHSLGKKCDCVGWSNLKRDDPRADEILQKIADFCRRSGWTARGLYTRQYTDLETDWYEITGTDFKDNTFGAYMDVPACDGSILKLCGIKAYRELTAAPKSCGHSLYVPERFYKVYAENNMEGLEFCWAKDTGKYAAEQYFAAFGVQRIPRVAVAWELKKQDLRKLGTDGGWLPRLGEVFHAWTQLNLPYCYKKEDMPAGGIAYAYIPDSFHCCGLYQVLVHKDVAKKLLQEKAIPAGALVPVPVLDQLPAGYTLRETTDRPRPTRVYREQSLQDYEALQRKVRPRWQISEKEVCQLLRKRKAASKTDFEKKLSKTKAESLVGTSYEPMLPYYAIADGGQLSEEYRLLSAMEAVAETAELENRMKAEELSAEKPEGIVIGACANGDRVLLQSTGSVIRFSHEGPETVAQWPSLPQFLADALQES